MALFGSLTILVIVILALYYYLKSRKNHKLPPGPLRWPFIGNLLSVGGKPHVTFEKWGKKYGPIIGAKFGFTDVLILTDAKLIREAFSDPVFSGRVDNKVFNVLSEGKHGILNSDGQEWTEQRRFVLKTLRDFGFGRQTMENFILEDVNEFLQWMKANEGQPTSVNNKFVVATVNSLWSIVAGKRDDHDDPIINKIMDSANEAFADIAKSGILLFFPELIDLLPNFLLRSWNKGLETLVPFSKIFSDTVKEHIESLLDEQHPRDLVDVYLMEVKKTTDPESSFYKARGYKTLEAVIMDLYSAGSGTTSATLTWAVLYLMKFPKIQARFQAELDEVIGKNRRPLLSDKSRLPYTDALTTEILRYSSIAPFGLFHCAMEDTTFHGYYVKKGTMVIGNLVSAHFNQNTWGDPENFRPDRFLSPDGKTIVKSESMIAFSAGKRQCLGESLARDTLFLFLTSIFQNFEILPDPAHPNPTLDPEVNFIQEPQMFTTIFKDRLH